MKKIFLGVATLSMLFGAVSCADERVESLADTNNIVRFDFGMKSQKQTRAEEVGLIDMQEDAVSGAGPSIDVLAYSTTSKDVVKTFAMVWRKETNEWIDDTTGGTPYPQPGFALRYYATYPSYDEQSGHITNPVSTTTTYGFTYTVQSGVVNDGESGQEDLLGAYFPATMAHDIPLKFDHLLSEVNFAVQALDGINITISEIKVENVFDVGNYIFPTGWESLHLSGDNGTYTYPSDTNEITNLQSGDYHDIRYLGNSKSTGYTHKNALMLLPQSFADSSEGSFTVKFSLTEKESGTQVAENKEAKIYFRDFDISKWEPGKRYIYVIDFTNYFASGNVNITMDVNTWEDADGSDTAHVVQVSLPTVPAIHDAISKQSENKKANTTLTRFPISVPETISESRLITPTFDNFVVGDKVFIECADEDSARNIAVSVQNVSAPYWVVSYSGSVAILTLTPAQS